jgi:PHD finger-like domain-containing protein 5A
MALRHSGTDQEMCRRLSGTTFGRVCNTHERRCVICDGMCEGTAEPVLICDICSIPTAGGEMRCVVCAKMPAVEVATYCGTCVLLEKDRDGCPRVLNQSRHQRMAQVRNATA